MGSQMPDSLKQGFETTTVDKKMLVYPQITGLSTYQLFNFVYG